MNEMRLIDANYLKEKINYLIQRRDSKNKSEYYNGRLDSYEFVLRTIDSTPTEEVSKVLAKEAREIADENYKYGYEKGKAENERPKGEWIRYRDDPHQPEHIKCSNCGQYWSIADHDKTFDFCFKCGAEMRDSKE